jgi:hypothetical protein
MGMAGDHPGAICSDDAAQLGHRHRQPMVSQQPVRPQSATPIAP